MSKKVKTKNSNDFIERCKLYVSANEKLMTAHKIKGRPIIAFPYRRRLPLLCVLAIKYIIAKGGIIDTKYEDLK